jgi:hypothetical membrane protein
MPALSILTVACAALWAALVLVVQVLTPEHDVLTMGMSALATGRHGWMMKAAFVVRGLTALALVATVAANAPVVACSLAGLVFFALWGGGSALLACYDTDMPGQKPTRNGAVHVLVALLAYVSAVIGMALISWAFTRAHSTSGLARVALVLTVLAAIALLAQFAGFGAAAREARSGRGRTAGGAAAGRAGPKRFGSGLARYAGLLQRIFVVLVMVWAVIVAIGV